MTKLVNMFAFHLMQQVREVGVMETQIRKSEKRSTKRSRSGAHAPCPVCSKKLRGIKGLRAHLKNEHPDECTQAGLEAVADAVLAEITQ